MIVSQPGEQALGLATTVETRFYQGQAIKA
jgi:hypothetical protein